MAQVREIVDQELGFAEATETPKQTAFLCIVNKRVVGMVLAEVIETGYLLISSRRAVNGVAASPNNSESNHEIATNRRRGAPPNVIGLERSTESHKAVLGIYQMWVHLKYRNRGIARALVDAARVHMVFGLKVPVDQVAFSSPTESGVRFARQYNSHLHTTASPQSHLDCGSNNNLEVLVYDCCH